MHVVFISLFGRAPPGPVPSAARGAAGPMSAVTRAKRNDLPTIPEGVQTFSRLIKSPYDEQPVFGQHLGR